LAAASLTAVLVHERHHLRARDPLRVLGERLLGGYGWFLPVLGWWMRRAAARREVAADQAAAARAGVAAVAGALLKLADRPTPAAVAAVNPAGNLPERIAHLEGQPPRPHRIRGWLLGGATVLNLGGLCAAVACCAGLGVAMLGGLA
jgi:beta-lactamase regulating signal transducer with metallopeptidase domain